MGSYTLPGNPGNKKGGWSGSAKLVTGDTLRELSLQADFPRAETYCLEFNKFSANLNSDFPIRAEAFIKWSVEGNWVTRRISIANGTTIQGVAQAVVVKVKDVTIGASPGPIEYEVTAQVTPGTRGSNQFPPFLSPVDGFNRLTPATPTAGIIIPQDAGAISVNVQAVGIGAGGPFDFSTLPAGALFVTMQQNGVFISMTEYTGPNTIIPIVPGSDRILLSADFAVIPGYTAIQTTTMFGIDG